MNALFFLILLLSFLSAIALPFTTYALSLSLFGIPHVLIELRYIRHRFQNVWQPWLERSIVLLLVCILMIRTLMLFGLITPPIAQPLELMCGLGLILLATHHLLNHRHPSTLIGILLTALLSFGILQDPLTTLILIAIFHNFTPIGFLLDRHANRRTQLTLLLLFLILPLTIILIQTHLPPQTHPHLSAFIPPLWQSLPIAYPLFSAITYLQCLHYTIILNLFPQWTPKPPDPKAFYTVLILITLTFFLSFQTTFPLTRALYSIPAALHAWIEIPILLLLLQSKDQQSHPIGHPIRHNR
jgi:hypothetical protein